MAFFPGPHPVLIGGSASDRAAMRRRIRACQDVTDLVEAQHVAELSTAANRAAESSSRARSEFVSHLSHELRTPLNAVIGFAQLLEHQQLGEPELAMVAQIRTAGGHLLALVEDVLDLAQIEGGVQQTVTEHVDVAHVVTEAVDLIRPAAAERDLAVGLDSDGPIVVAGDRRRILQVALNLLANAVKYNRHGGSIDVSVRPIHPDTARITVTDSGEGIPAGSLERIFDPFVRLDTHAAAEGSGLGLAVTRGLVERMRGSMGVESELGRGSSFMVDLPLVDAAFGR